MSMELIGLGNNDVKNNEKQSRRAAAQKRDDFMMNRLMILLAGVIVVIVLLLYLRRDSRDFDVVFINKVLPFLKGISAVALIGAIVNVAVQRKKGTDESLRYLSSTFLCGIAVTFFLMCFAYAYTLLIGTVVIMLSAVVLHFIYCFYPRDFFWASVTALCGGLLLYFGALDGTSVALKGILSAAGKILAIALPIILLAAAALLRKNNGMIVRGGKRVLLMKRGYLYSPFVVLSAITLVSGVISLFFHPMVTVALIVMAVVYIAYAIAYTVKMI